SMMKKALLTDDECWLRVQARDASADGRFVFAVRTTGVFCRPSPRRYLDHLKMEYAFWMDGAESLALNQAYRHVVRMPDGSLLNR
ncbi:hypothetical protein MJM59_28080, partial [Salmonella enterica subsp. enterica serovar Montevideo]|nr:hypothetical protein [Salmonella enterica subsp. enterica serovar Montevideo]